MLTMRRGKSSKSERICCLAIIAVAMWLGGAGCALCCGLETTDAYFDEKPAASCHTKAQVENRQKQSSEDHSTDSISGQEGLKDCSLLPNQATSLAVTSRADAAPDLPEDQPLLIEAIVSRKEIFIPAHLPLKRGQAYLQFCALLI